MPTPAEPVRSFSPNGERRLRPGEEENQGLFQTQGKLTGSAKYMYGSMINRELYTTVLNFWLQLLQDLEARSYDPVHSMTANQAVKVLVESYMNSEYYLTALSRMHEINHIVSL